MVGKGYELDHNLPFEQLFQDEITCPDVSSDMFGWLLAYGEQIKDKSLPPNSSTMMSLGETIINADNGRFYLYEFGNANIQQQNSVSQIQQQILQGEVNYLPVDWSVVESEDINNDYSTWVDYYGAGSTYLRVNDVIIEPTYACDAIFANANLRLLYENKYTKPSNKEASLEKVINKHELKYVGYCTNLKTGRRAYIYRSSKVQPGKTDDDKVKDLIPYNFKDSHIVKIPSNSLLANYLWLFRDSVATPGMIQEFLSFYTNFQIPPDWGIVSVIRKENSVYVILDKVSNFVFTGYTPSLKTIGFYFLTEELDEQSRINRLIDSEISRLNTLNMGYAFYKIQLLKELKKNQNLFKENVIFDKMLILSSNSSFPQNVYLNQLCTTEELDLFQRIVDFIEDKPNSYNIEDFEDDIYTILQRIGYLNDNNDARKIIYQLSLAYVASKKLSVDLYAKKAFIESFRKEIFQNFQIEKSIESARQNRVNTLNAIPQETALNIDKWINAFVIPRFYSRHINKTWEYGFRNILSIHKSINYKHPISLLTSMNIWNGYVVPILLSENMFFVDCIRNYKNILNNSTQDQKKYEKGLCKQFAVYPDVTKELRAANRVGLNYSGLLLSNIIHENSKIILKDFSLFDKNGVQISALPQIHPFEWKAQESEIIDKVYQGNTALFKKNNNKEFYKHIEIPWYTWNYLTDQQKQDYISKYSKIGDNIDDCVIWKDNSGVQILADGNIKLGEKIYNTEHIGFPNSVSRRQNDLIVSYGMDKEIYSLFIYDLSNREDLKVKKFYLTAGPVSDVIFYSDKYLVGRIGYPLDDTLCVIDLQTNSIRYDNLGYMCLDGIKYKDQCLLLFGGADDLKLYDPLTGYYYNTEIKGMGLVKLISNKIFAFSPTIDGKIDIKCYKDLFDKNPQITTIAPSSDLYVDGKNGRIIYQSQDGLHLYDTVSGVDQLLGITNGLTLKRAIIAKNMNGSVFLDFGNDYYLLNCSEGRPFLIALPWSYFTGKDCVFATYTGVYSLIGSNLTDLCENLFFTTAKEMSNSSSIKDINGIEMSKVSSYKICSDTNYEVAGLFLYENDTTLCVLFTTQNEDRINKENSSYNQVQSVRDLYYYNKNGDSWKFSQKWGCDSFESIGKAFLAGHDFFLLGFNGEGKNPISKGKLVTSSTLRMYPSATLIDPKALIKDISIDEKKSKLTAYEQGGSTYTISIEL